MKTAADTHTADLTVLRKRVAEAAGHEDQGVVQCHIADVLVRQRSGMRQPLEVSRVFAFSGQMAYIFWEL